MVPKISASDTFYEEKSLHFCKIENSNQTNDIIFTKKEDMEWCKRISRTYHVIIGKSFGGMGISDRNKWLSLGCAGILTIGRPYTCYEKYGLGFIDLWKKNSKKILSSSSSSDVTCYSTIKSNIACNFKNIILDFSKIEDKNNIRNFNKGFIQIYGVYNQNITHDSNNNIKIPSVIGGIDVINSKLDPN